MFVHGRSGTAVLRRAAELCRPGTELSVVTLAPQAHAVRCCGAAAVGPYNCAVREDAREELREARSLLGPLAEGANFTTLSGRPQPPLADYVAEMEFQRVLVPAPRIAWAGGRLARTLRRRTRAQVTPVHG